MAKVSVNNDALQEGVIYAYDGTYYRVVKCDGDGNIAMAVKAGETFEVVQDTPADLKATVNIASGQSVKATQDTYTSLLGQARNVPVFPVGVTDLIQRSYFGALPATHFLEYFSGTTGAALAGLGGRTVASGKTVQFVLMAGQDITSTAGFTMGFSVDATIKLVASIPAPGLSLVFPVAIPFVGDGIKVYRIWMYNNGAGAAPCSISCICWEEDTL